MKLYEKTDIPYPQNMDHLTSLRFYAAFVVLVLHVNLAVDLTLPLQNFIQHGYLGVDFFFILSGFIITHVYASPLLEKKVSPKTFIVKRFARLWPLHIFCLLLICLAQLFQMQVIPDYTWPENYTLRSFLMNFFLVQAWSLDGLNPFYNLPSWSISAEFSMYILFLFFLEPYHRLKNKGFIAITLSFLLLLTLWFYSLAAIHTQLTAITYEAGILRILPEFLFGMALYIWGSRFQLIYCSSSLIFAAGTGVFVFANFVKIPDLFCIPLFGLIILIAAEQARKNKTNMLTKKMSIHLGEISYALYMVHFIFTILAINLLDSHIARIFTIIGSSFIAAEVLYRYIETPARKWITAKYAK